MATERLRTLRVDNSIVSLRGLPGRGDGTFTDPTHYAARGSDEVSASYFNGDGRLDLAALGSGSLDLSILFGRGDGTFSSHGRCEAVPVAWSLRRRDFNGDGPGSTWPPRHQFRRGGRAWAWGRYVAAHGPLLRLTRTLGALPWALQRRWGGGGGGGWRPALTLATASRSLPIHDPAVPGGSGTFQPGLTYKVDRGGTAARSMS